MKKVKRFIVLILSLIFTVTQAVGCGDEETAETEKEPTIKETAEYLIKEGKSNYSIVLADNSTGYEAYAAEELAGYIKQASEVELPIKTESQVTVNASSECLLVGVTESSKTAGVTVDKNVYGARGYVIKRVDKNVYIVGGDTMGTLYGVYEFLHYQFGFEPYAIDEIALERGVINKKLLDFNVSDIPDIAHIQGTYEYWGNTNVYAGHRMRYNHFNEVFVNATGQPWHNSLEYAPPAQYKEEHPKWYTDNGLQYHYTAHGDEKELKALQDLIFERIVFFIERDFAKGKYYEQIGFMAEDYDNSWAQSDEPYNQGAGETDSVLALKAKYGKAYAAAMLIHFINPIQERVKQYMAEHHDGRKMSITVFAYFETEAAPVKVVNGEYVPVDDSVILHPDANILIAPIRADYLKDYSENSIKATVDSWKVLSSNFSFWFYEYYFSTNSLIHLDSTYSIQTYLQAARDTHATYVFFETPLGFSNYYVFGKLKAYLISKLGWNVDANVHTLVADFFDNYYKEASGNMKKYFDELTNYCAYIKGTTNITGVTGSSGADITGFWNEGVVSGWIDIINKAYKDIEPLKETDKETYQKLHDRILYDSLSPRYILLKHFAKEAFTDETFVKELAQFKADCKYLGIVRAANVIIDELSITR